MKKMIYPVTVTIPGRDDFLVILNVNITTECKYLENGTKCTFWNETLRKDSECFISLPECSVPSTCNCSDLITDEIRFCPDDVSSLIQKVTAKGTFTMNRQYFAEFQNISSNTYQDLNNNLTTLLANSFSNLKGFQCVKILQFRNGSLIVEFELNINGELSSKDFISQAKDAISLIGSEVNNDSLKLKVEGLLKMVIPKVIPYKKPVNLSCIIKDRVDESEWFIRAPRDKEDAPIAKRRYDLKHSDQSTVSNLSIEATAIWKGNYSCSMSFDNQLLVHKVHRDVQINLLPDEIIITPSNYTELGKTHQLARFSNKVQCCIKESIEGNVTLQSDNNTCANVLRGNRTTLNNQICWTFTVNCTFEKNVDFKCIFTNGANESTNGLFSLIFLIENSTKCPTEYYKGHTWDSTQANSFAESNSTCEEGSVGKIIRFCDEKGQWQNVFQNCTNLELLKLWDISTEIKEGRGNLKKVVPEVLDELNNTLKAKEITIANSRISVKILDSVSQAVNNSNSEVSFTEVSKFLSIGNELIQQKIQEAEGPMDQISDSSTLMMSIETFASAMNSTEEDGNQSLPQIQLKAKEFKANSKDHYFVNFSGNSIATLNVTGWGNSSNNATVKISSLLFPEIDKILPSTDGNQTVNSQILTTTIISNNNKNDTIRPNIILTLSPKNQSFDLKSARCVFWDYSFIDDKQIGWSPNGCTTETIGSNIRCTCNHLTSFAVLMSPMDIPIPFIDELTYIGLSISMMSLLIWITIEKITWKTITKSSIAYSRHITQLNTAVALLLGQISFLIGGSEYIKKNDHLCTVATIFTQFFFLSTFFWTLNQSLTLLHQIIFVFHHIGRLTFISFCFVIGYGCPLAIVIAATTSFLKINAYKRKDSCWLNATLNPKFSAFLTFIIPVGCIIAINIIILTIVILKLLRPNISEGLKEREKKTIKKIIKAVLIFTPTFGLTWIVGFALLKDNSDYLHYAFVLLNSLQGLFILLTAGFTEKKIREALVNHFKPMVSRTTSENVQTKQSFQSSTK
ncbi:adhesion G protein-coupled receptor F4-like [Rhinoraja longicauda]